MRQEYSLKKLFLGLTFKPENKARPSSATSGMTRLLCSRDQSLSAKQARKACAGGIIREPGRRAAWASVSTGRRASSGRDRNRPPHAARKGGGAGENPRAWG